MLQQGPALRLSNCTRPTPTCAEDYALHPNEMSTYEQDVYVRSLFPYPANSGPDSCDGACVSCLLGTARTRSDSARRPYNTSVPFFILSSYSSHAKLDRKQQHTCYWVGAFLSSSWISLTLLPDHILPVPMALCPMLRVYDATVRYIDQGRPVDIFEFIDLRKNHSKEQMRARDLFLALGIPDLL